MRELCDPFRISGPFIPLCNIGEVSTSFMVPSVNEEQDSVSRDAGQTELFFYICLKF